MGPSTSGASTISAAAMGDGRVSERVGTGRTERTAGPRFSGLHRHHVQTFGADICLDAKRILDVSFARRRPADARNQF